jgi:NADPH:quinone reductase-like Zn-dependent oxidoreductase
LTSSSQAKLDRAVTLLGPLLRVGGAADTLQTIDYSKVDDWDVEAKRLNGGMGVDFVIEIAGRGTIGRSIRSTRQGGLIAVSGKLARTFNVSHLTTTGYMSTYSHIPDEIYKEGAYLYDSVLITRHRKDHPLFRREREGCLCM